MINHKNAPNISIQSKNYPATSISQSLIARGIDSIVNNRSHNNDIDNEKRFELAVWLFEGGRMSEADVILNSLADNGYGPAILEIYYYERDLFGHTKKLENLLIDAINWYERRSKTGDVDAQCQLGLLYINETDKTKYIEGLSWLKQSALNGSSRACEQLGEKYLKTVSTDAHLINEAIHFLVMAADLGRFHACRTLGDLYLLGHVGKTYGLKQGKFFQQLFSPDIEKAIYWYQRGISLHKRDAEHLASLYLKGELLEQNFQLAEKWFLVAAEAGNEGAKLKLGSEYLNGKKFEQNATKAIYWLELAAKTLTSPKLLLAEIYFDGIFVKKEFLIAMYWIQSIDIPAARRLSNNAMNLVNKKCFDGRFSKLEEEFAKEWLHKMVTAAHELISDQDNDAYPSHAYFVAEIFELGLGVELNMDKAIHWYKEAAIHGYQMAKNRLSELGIMY
jgi:TPR repeat protein